MKSPAAQWTRVRQFSWPLDAAEITVATPDVVFVACNGHISYMTTDRGATWREFPLRDVFSINVRPGAAEEIYVGTPSGMFTSRDGGLTWTGPNQLFSGSTTRVVFDPVDPKRLYANAGGSCNTLECPGGSIARSDDGGSTWKIVGFPGYYTIALAADAAVRGRVFAASVQALRNPDDPRDASVFVSRDGAETWEKYIPEYNYTLHIWSDPVRSGTVWAIVISQHWSILCRTTDDGVTWTAPLAIRGDEGPLEIRSVAIDPIVPRRVFVGTDVGLYFSPDDGSTWQVIPINGVDRPRVASVVFPPETDQVMYAILEERDPGGLAGNVYKADLGDDPVCRFSIQPFAAAVGTPIRFVPEIPGTPLASEWNFGDGVIEKDTLVTTTHAYTAPGKYTVTLTLRGKDLVDYCSGTVTILDGSPRKRGIRH